MIPARTGRRLLLTAAGVPLLACAAPAPPINSAKAVADPTVKERAADVPEVAPIERDGRRYAAVPWGRARGLGQNGGYLAVIDARTGRELQLVKIYGPESGDDREGDKQDVFISALAFDSDDRLRVFDERGRQYLVGLPSLKVTRPKS